MLQPLLQEYLIEDGNLPMPGSGRLSIQSTPASLKDAIKTLTAPVNKIAFSDTPPTESEVQQLTTFIAHKLSISGDESKQLLENELGVGEKVASDGERLNWSEWNLFQTQKEDVNENSISLNDYLTALQVEKIHRQPVTVAEPITQSIGQPAEIVTAEAYPAYEETVSKDYWWVWAIAILITSVLLILFRLRL